MARQPSNKTNAIATQQPVITQTTTSTELVDQTKGNAVAEIKPVEPNTGENTANLDLPKISEQQATLLPAVNDQSDLTNAVKQPDPASNEQTSDEKDNVQHTPAGEALGEGSSQPSPKPVVAPQSNELKITITNSHSNRNYYESLTKTSVSPASSSEPLTITRQQLQRIKSNVKQLNDIEGKVWLTIEGDS